MCLGVVVGGVVRDTESRDARKSPQHGGCSPTRKQEAARKSLQLEAVALSQVLVARTSSDFFWHDEE